MPVDGSRVPPKRAEDRQEQALKAAARQSERGMNVVAPGQTEQEAREEDAEQVRSTKELDGPIIDAESRGAHSFDLKKKEKEGKEEKPVEDKKIDDPEGRGVNLDVRI